jgi:hypothetical protein
MKSNSFAMKDWHLDHVEKLIVQYIKGISPYASSLEKRNFKKYSTLFACAKQIEYDIRHGVTTDEVLSVKEKLDMTKNSQNFNQTMRLCKDWWSLKGNSQLQKKCRHGNYQCL